jgi:hypothetical protein
MKGKQPRFTFELEVDPRANHALWVVHYDVCGPFEVGVLKNLVNWSKYLIWTELNHKKLKPFKWLINWIVYFNQFN